MFVCLLVCGGLMEIQTPAPILMKFCTHILTCPRKVLVQVWLSPPHPLGLGAWNPKFNNKKNGRTVVCLSVGMWRANENPNPPHQSWWNFAHISPPVQGRFWYRFDPRPAGPGGPKILKAEGDIFENSFENKIKYIFRDSNFTRAMPGTLS